MRELAWLKSKVCELETKKGLPKTLTGEVLSNSVRENCVMPKSCHKILVIMEPQYAGIALKMLPVIAQWCRNAVSQLSH